MKPCCSHFISNFAPSLFDLLAREICPKFPNLVISHSKLKIISFPLHNSHQWKIWEYGIVSVVEKKKSTINQNNLVYNSGANSRYVSSDGKDLSSRRSSGSSMPLTPRGENEILESSKLKSFGFNDLKVATRNFRPDSVLGEGGFGCVFKGWIDEHSFKATRPGTGIVIAVKRLNQEGLQGHKEWLVSSFVHPKSLFNNLFPKIKIKI